MNLNTDRSIRTPTNGARTPFHILSDRADQLNQTFNGALTWKVSTFVGWAGNEKSEDKKRFWPGLEVVVPALNHRRVEILSVLYSNSLYPLRVRTLNDAVFTCTTEQEFIKVLKKILNSSETRRIMQSLLSQSETAQLDALSN